MQIIITNNLLIDAAIVILCLAVLFIGSISDLKKREVPDFISFGLICIGFGIKLIYSAATNDWMIFVYGLIGFFAFLILAYIMFYAGQWGGGDAKIIMGLGIMLGLNYNEYLLTTPLISFIINSIFVGAAYGIVWTVALAIKNRKKFMVEAKKIALHEEFIMARRILFGLIIISLVLAILVKEVTQKLLMVGLCFSLFLTLFLWLFVKAVEKSSMFKFIEPKCLTEGDWIAEEIWYKDEKKKTAYQYLKEKYKEYYEIKVYSWPYLYIRYKVTDQKNSFSEYLNILAEQKLEQEITRKFRTSRLKDKEKIKALLSAASKSCIRLGSSEKDSFLKKLENEGYTFESIRIAGPKDLGVDKKQIALLDDLYKNGAIKKKVIVKEGIPFIPNFFLSFVATLIVGNIMLAIFMMF